MSDESAEKPIASPRFGEAKFKKDAPTPKQCHICQAPLEIYYRVNAENVCQRCTQLLQSTIGGGVTPGQFLRAAVFGIGAAVVGSGIYWGVRALTGLEVGYISILVGYLVGRFVRTGARGRGGISLQLLAVFLTYTSIVSSYVPYFLENGRFSILLVPLLYTIPFLDPVKNAIGLLIIAIGVFQAWSMNKRPKLDVRGPFSAPQAPPVAAVPEGDSPIGAPIP